VKSAITNPIFPDLDLSFYPNVLRKYVHIKKSTGIVKLNIASLALTAICVASLRVVAVIETLSSF